MARTRDDDRDDNRPDNDEPDDRDEDDEPDDDTGHGDDDPDDDPDDRDAQIKDLRRRLTNSRRQVRRLRAGTRDTDRRPAGRDDRQSDRDRDDRNDRDRRDDDQDDRDRRDRRDEERREAKAERRALVAQAETALLRAGCDPDMADMLAERVRERDVDFDDDDRPDFSEWIDDLREGRPRAFGARRRREDEDDDDRPRRRRAPSLDQGAASGGGRRREEPPQSLGARMIQAGRRADGVSDRRRRR